jgi:hypothetical protein
LAQIRLLFRAGGGFQEKAIPLGRGARGSSVRTPPFKNSTKVNGLVTIVTNCRLLDAIPCTRNRRNRPITYSPSARQWWETTVTTYVLESHHLLLLQAAAEAWDSAKPPARRSTARG